MRVFSGNRFSYNTANSHQKAKKFLGLTGVVRGGEGGAWSLFLSLDSPLLWKDFYFLQIDPFYMTSRQQYWATKQKHGDHVGVSKNPVKITFFSRVKTFFC